MTNRTNAENEKDEGMAPRSRAGRKAIQIDLVELEKLCSLHCTDQELADWFGASTRTIESRRKRPEFADAMRRGRSKGRISVRRAQMKMLESGNGTMGVWLGKQVAGAARRRHQRAHWQRRRPHPDSRETRFFESNR
jgi:hypothetical protein